MKSAIFALILLIGASAHAQILSENFRNTDCANCRQPDIAFEQFVANNPQYNIITVNIHNSNPFNGDPFYLESQNDVEARSTTLYGVIGDPTMFINGYSAGNAESKWEQLAKEAAKQTLPATLTVSSSVSANKMVTVNVHIESGNVGKQVKPLVYILESGIKFYNPRSYKNYADSTWNNILRATAPSATGGDAFTLSGAKDLTITYDASARSWDMLKLTAVVFLQDVSKVTPGTNYPLEALKAVPITSLGVKRSAEWNGYELGNPIFNVNDGKTILPISIAKPTSVKITLCDMLGNDVATVYDGFINQTEFSTDITTSHLANGMYFVRMFANGSLVDVKKIVVSH